MLESSLRAPICALNPSLVRFESLEGYDNRRRYQSIAPSPVKGGAGGRYPVPRKVQLLHEFLDLFLFEPEEAIHLLLREGVEPPRLPTDAESA